MGKRAGAAAVVGTALVTAFGVLVGPIRPALVQGASTKAALLGSFGPLMQEANSLVGDIDCGARGVNFSSAPVAPRNCKPAAMAIAVLSNGSELYWDGLEGMNQISLNTVAQYGAVAIDDQSRVMRMTANGPVWQVPSPPTGGSSAAAGSGDYLPGVPHWADPGGSSDLFCSALVQLPDGRVMSAGGTDYYLEPGAGTPAGPFGVSELEGLRVTRIFDPKTNSWSFSGNMNYGRWYPTMVTLPSGQVFVASGVTKLIKPAYLGGKGTGYQNGVADSGSNVRQTETYNPATGTWSYNGPSADKSLPLFPRLHLLPDGNIYYDAAGQAFNPMGEALDEALWNLTSVYNPTTQQWTNLGLPNIGGLPLGFRGSGFSLMMPLVPDADGNYTKAQFLSAGGVIGVTPGSYFGTSTSTLNTVDTSLGDAFSSHPTGPLTQARWYSTGVLLPDGEVFAVNGASADEVMLPGTAFPIRQAELYNPDQQKWHPAAFESDGRTYHNTAVLLPDGTVLVGGHAPIATGYAFQDDVGHEMIGLSQAESNPTFQIYRPPYLNWGYAQPTITGVSSTKPGYGSTLEINTPQAGSIAKVVLVRNPSLTHLVEFDQRTVELAITGQSGSAVDVAMPGSAVVPPGPYMLFVLQKTPRGLVPSVAQQVFAGAS